MMSFLRRINWHVFLVVLGSLLVAGGPVAYVFTSFHVSADVTADYLQRGSALVALALSIGAGVRMAMTQTDKGKADTLASLDASGKQRVIDNMHVDDQVALGKALHAALTSPPKDDSKKGF